MHNCRFCDEPLTHVFVDLGYQPLSNAILTSKQLYFPEVTYPLKVYVCLSCWLVQLPEFKQAEDIFNSDYPYYSSYSKTMVNHAKEYVDMIIPKLGLTEKSKIVEIASNDGYLLRNFPWKTLGIEPAKGPANFARSLGIPTETEFFGVEFAIQYDLNADLIIANNVLAHVPDLNDFVIALKLSLAPGGVITIEVPHLMRLIEGLQFDTIYHEHYSYFSFGTICTIFQKHGLEVFDVEELSIHGGSLRVYAQHKKPISDYVIRDFDIRKNTLLLKERQKVMNSLINYEDFQSKIEHIALNLNGFLIAQWELGRRIVSYGAAAKFNTLLNYCGIKPYLIPYVCDVSPHKQGKFLPGSHIPILKPEVLEIYKPDYILIAPWNIKDEIMEELSYVRDWGCQFVTAIPRLEIL